MTSDKIENLGLCFGLVTPVLYYLNKFNLICVSTRTVWLPLICSLIIVGCLKLMSYFEK